MTRARLSCTDCGQEIRPELIQEGRAAILQNRVLCPPCLDAYARTLTPEKRRVLFKGLRRVQKATGTAPMIPAADPPSPGRLRRPVILAVAAAVTLGGIVGAILLLSGGGEEVEREPPSGRPSKESSTKIKARPEPATGPSPSVDTGEAPSGRDPHAAARAFDREHRDDPEQIIQKYRKAAGSSKGTHERGQETDREPTGAERTLLDRMDTETQRLREDLLPLLEGARFAKALELCRSRRDLFGHPEWKRRIEGFMNEVEARAVRAFESLVLQAETLAKEGQVEQARNLLRRAEGFGIERLRERAAKVLAELEHPARAKASGKSDPVKPAPKPDVEVQRRELEAAWAYAVRMARGRDYDRAIEAIEFARDRMVYAPLKEQAGMDLANLCKARDVFLTAIDRLKKIKPGKRVSLRIFDDEIRRTTVHGRVFGVTDTGILLEGSRGGVQYVPFTSLHTREIVDAFLDGPDGRKSRAALGLFALFDGDPGIARRYLAPATLPQRYADLTRADPAEKADPRRSLKEEREDEARRLLESAEADFKVGRKEQAALAYRKLKKKYRTTEVYRRNRERIERRLKSLSEVVILSDGIRSTGLWQRQSVPGCPLGTAWVLPMTIPEGYRDPGKAATYARYFVEAHFFGIAGENYRVWVLTGGDAPVNTAFRFQLSGAKGGSAAPGKADWIEVPPLSSTAGRRTEGTTTTWGWQSLGIHRFERTGPQTIRIFGWGKGLAVSAIVISAEKYMHACPAVKDLKKP